MAADRKALLKELEEVPEEHLEALSEVIHYYIEGIKLKLDASGKRRSMMDYAGIWADMSDDEFEAVLAPYHDRSQWPVSSEP